MQITLEMLQEMNACEESVLWFKEQNTTDLQELCLKATKEGYFDWANWLVAKLLTKENRIKYAVFAAESVLYVFEEEYPNDDRPRKAIETTKAYINDPSEENKLIVRKIATRVHAAACGTIHCPNEAATEAAYSATAAAYSVNAIGRNGYSFAYNAVDDTQFAQPENIMAILMYGLGLIEKQENV